MINEKIRDNITDEFTKLKESCQKHLTAKFDVSQSKKFLQTYIPKEVVYKSQILLDTLLNYLMKDAREKLKNKDSKLQNAFFDADLRKSVHEWAAQLQNKFSLDSDIVKYSFDPRLVQGLTVSGITFVAGAGISATLAPNILGAIVSGIAVILISALTFKLAYDKASPKARRMVKTDIDQYLKESQQQVSDWLGKVEKVFDNYFCEFCSAKNIELRGK